MFCKKSRCSLNSKSHYYSLTRLLECHFGALFNSANFPSGKNSVIWKVKQLFNAEIKGGSYQPAENLTRSTRTKRQRLGFNEAKKLSVNSGFKKRNWWLQGKMPNEFKFQWPLTKPKKVLIVMSIFFQLSKIRDKGREEMQLLATAGCASPENIFPGSLHDRRSSRQGPAENSDFVLSQQGAFFLAGYLNSSPASEGLWFGHRVKYRFKRPTLAWPQKASQLSSSRINSLISLLTSKQSSCSELG